MKLKLAAIIVFFSSAAFAAFETMPDVSVRAQGMGGAFVGMSDDAMSALINPAGLVRIDRDSVGLGYSSLYPGLVNDSISQNLLAGALHGTNSAWGLTLSQLNSSKYKEFMYTLTSSFRLSDIFTIGANFKYLGWGAATLQYFNGTSESLSRSNYGLDLGCQAFVTDEICWGLNLANINRPDIGSVAQELMPLNAKTGLWYGRQNGFNVAADLTMENRKQSFALGVEQWFSGKKYALRGGWQSQLDGGSVSVGATYKQGKPEESPFGIDFAYIYPVVMKNLPVMRLATTFWFGNKPKKEFEVGFSKRFSEMNATDFEEVQKKEGEQKLKDIMAKTASGDMTQIKFEPNSDRLAQGYDTVDQIGPVLFDYPMLNIRIEVHTDPLGDPDANMALTYKQADMLKDYLVKKFGIGAKRIEAIGYGGSRPIASVNEPGGAERNRRVEINVQ
jgi:outer membrane protein OmpA-like peptidoglycan-associated protein